jgi:tetratricopeptide (TPR) repeat protein
MIKWGFPLALMGLSGYYGIMKKCVDPYKKGSPTQKIQPPPNGKMYNGGWVNHTPDIAHLLCFENKFSQKVDIAFRFQNFKELQTDKPFPVSEAEQIRTRGGSIFIALEPWMGRGGKSLLADIAHGDFDKELEAYGKGAAAYDGPVFVAFAPGMNEGPEPWTKQNAELFIQAYRHVHEKVSKYGKNITWVWNVNLGEKAERYYPGNAYVDWIAVNFYHQRGESIKALEARLETFIKKLKTLGKPIMIGRFGSSGTTQEKAEFFLKIMKRFKAWGIKGFVYFNFAEIDKDGNLVNFMIQQELAVKAYRQALNHLDLDGNIVTRSGELPTLLPRVTPDNCAVIEGTYWTASDTRRTDHLRSLIKNRESYIDSNRTPQVNNKLRLQAADAYRELARLSKSKMEKKKYRRKALRHLKIALKTPDKSLIYHPKIKYVREYFEIILKIPDIYLEMGKNKKAIAWLNRTDRNLSNRWMMVAQNVSPDSVPGYENRSLLTRGQSLERRGIFNEARRLYVQVDKWATNEQSRSWAILKWRGEDRTKVRFIAIKARLGLMRFDLRRSVRQTPEDASHTLGRVLQRANRIFKWEEIGEEGGFMDLSFETFIHAMDACMRLSGHNLQKAKDIFKHALPWTLINRYPDLKEALRIKGDLADESHDTWDMVLRGLLMPDVRIGGEDLKLTLSKLREFTDM